MISILIGAFAASLYGGYTAFRKKMPLFYKILFFAMLTGFMGAVYTVLFALLWPEEGGGFHVGYLGWTGMFFFLFSSYYGAIDSLADDGSAAFCRFRRAAGALAIVFFSISILMIVYFEKGLWLVLLLIPMSCTFYFAVKHLVIPDVEMGIIKVMRPYNAAIIGLCICMMLYFFAKISPEVQGGLGFFCGIFLVVCLPVARSGVRKWFIS